MCVTLGPARFAKTIIYANAVTKDDEFVHVLAYQNRAASHGPNAMILPIPANGSLGPENVINCQAVPWWLDALDRSAQERPRSMTKGMRLGAAPVAQVFDSGSYTVVLATEAEAIPEALLLVPAEKRPKNIPYGFFASYARLYPGWPIAVCCWSGHIQAEPLLWWFRPKFLNWFFLPAVDAHDGRPPQRDRTKVHRDHTLLWGSESGAYTALFPSPLPPAIGQFIDPKLHAVRPSGLEENGDYWAPTIGPKSILRRFPGNFTEFQQ